jgi:threonine/homoserine/homoserine lactone efflux protein
MFILTSVFGIFIPALIFSGPDFVAVVRSSMTNGTRAGIWTTLGFPFVWAVCGVEPAGPVSSASAISMASLGRALVGRGLSDFWACA